MVVLAAECSPTSEDLGLMRSKKRKESKVGETNFLINFPDDLLLQVFVRLPNWQSTIQCRAVSKHWCSLLSSSHFIRCFVHHQQLLNSNSNSNSMPNFTILITYRRDAKPSQIYSIFSTKSKPSPLSANQYLNFLPRLEWDRDPMVKTSCNDLLLVCHFGMLYICNHFTKKWLVLPPLDAPFGVCRSALMCTTDCKYNYKYKVVIVTFTLPVNPFKFRVAIFCSKTWKWCKYMVSSPQPLSFERGFIDSDGAVVCNGMLHWIDGSPDFRGIVALDPLFVEQKQKQCVFYIDPPAEIPPGSVYLRKNEIFMWACQGRLRLSYLVCTENYIYLRVWELRNYDNTLDSWCLKHETTISFETNPRITRPSGLACNPNIGDIIYLLDRVNYLIYECDITKSELKKVGQLPLPVMLSDHQIAFPIVYPVWPTPVPDLPSI